VRHVRGHDDALARAAEVLHAADGELSAALQHEHHRVALGAVRADLLALGKGEQRDADGVVLGQRLADDLPRGRRDLVRQLQGLRVLDILNINHIASPSRRPAPSASHFFFFGFLISV